MEGRVRKERKMVMKEMMGGRDGENEEEDIWRRE